MNMMQPQQPPPQMAPPPRAQQAPVEPLPTPYGKRGNSMGLLSMKELEEEKRRRRMMGY
jgi:hypothetical protein